jgi:hypothetical protein
LSGVRAPYGIRNSDAVDTDLVNGLVDRKEIYEIRTEAVLGRETDFNTLGLDEGDDFNGSLGDVIHVLAM